MSDPILTIDVTLPTSLEAGVRAKLERAREQDVGGRVQRADPTLWGPPGAPEIANRLGWLTIAERMLADADELAEFAREAHAEGLRDVVLLGMGGSSLAAEVLRLSFETGAGSLSDGRPELLRLHVLDSTDAATISSVQQAIDLPRTLFLVSSKSGGTVEPLSMFAHFWSLVEDGSRFVAITDPGSGLVELAEQHDFRRVFFGDPDIGGRYSALSAFGLVPAALMGIDVRALLEGSRAAAQTHVSYAGDEHPAAVWLGAALSALAQAGRDKLTFVVSESLSSLGLWLEQLVAESTGKQATGILPVAQEPLGDPAVYGADRVFAYLPDVRQPDPERDRAVRALADAGHPVITIPTGGPADLGRIFLLAETAVAVSGWGLEINPFDQPNVQQAKDATKRVLEQFEQRGALPTVDDADLDRLRALLAGAGSPTGESKAADPSAPTDPHADERGPYLAIMGYLQPSEEFDAAIAELRVAIRAHTKLTTTFGYGPRFLHSTGQFHKGGPPVGRFLQLIHDAPEDVQIPGAPYSFTTLKNAQAIGDLHTLRELGRPAERVRLAGADPAGALRALTQQIKETP